MTIKHYVGLDVSARSASLCVIDADSRVVHERKMSVDPQVIATHIVSLGLNIVGVGLEAGARSQMSGASIRENQRHAASTPPL